MQLEKLSVRLRPRGGWEALDLGFHMARTWWRQVWGTWLAVYLPAAIVLHVLVYEQPFIAIVLLWWLKPLFDRFVLHVVSRAVFGDIPTVRATLGAWRQVLRPGLASALLWYYRLSPFRSFTMPVAQLEQQTGRAGAGRRRTLRNRAASYAGWLTFVCGMFEGFLFLALGVFVVLLVPGVSSPAPEFSNLLGNRGGEGAWTWFNSFCYVAAVCMVEPFYVAGGFSLYLNRRAVLEGWDVELQLRRLDERLRGAATAAALVLAVLCFAPSPFVPAAHAQQKSAAREIEEVMKAPELNPWRDEKQWRLRPSDTPKEEKPERDGPNLGWLGKLFAQVMQGLAWVAAIVVAAILVWYGVKHLRQHFASREEAWRPPEVLFGLSVTPESLPDDVAATAAALAREGQVREALSLLYRGALSVLVHRDRVRLVEGDTEGDALRVARDALAEAAAEYFATLVRAWTMAAYAGRLPASADAEAMARAWKPYFGSPAQAAAA